MRIPAHEIATTVDVLYDEGLPPGTSTGWPSIDKHYTVAPGQWTLITGVPNHGKSEFLDALMVNLSERANWTFEIFSPENAPTSLHVAKLLEKYQKKPFGAGPTERMTKEEVTEGMDFVNRHFSFYRYENAATVREILMEMAQKCRTTRGGLVIDPWNQCEHLRPSNMTEAEYLSQTLSDVIYVARQTQAHIWIIAHPKIMHRDKDGKRPVPTPYDVSGGAHWFNKADNIITIHREDLESQEVFIHVQKVRFKHIGKPGMVTLRYDRITGRYFEPLRVVESPEWCRV